MKEQMNLCSVLSILCSGCNNQMMDSVAPDCLLSFLGLFYLLAPLYLRKMQIACSFAL